ncbi:hypothetical protein RFI_12192 [Reticulomyxa filosa]|uniref:CNNM transmembrane domain-containing protein n=1 Tax=Reticulomyxa filosa TaxID=46433 RepID=X6NGD6_RETFI|nr:hypothetical protein RFI_12192 [Reticulomyxa filosa]|eukprot:ETO24953.1 hypothetical protein RFI_12192 [Reticulomyxa filosa]
MEALPIFLDMLVSSWLAVVISVTFVLVFGEIVPQAMFASDPLKAGYYLSWFVRLLQVVLFPICYPLSWLLDRIFAHQHQVAFTHKEMQTLFQVIAHDKDYDETKKEFDKDELMFLKGSLQLRHQKIKEEMVPWNKVKSLPYDLVLDLKGLKEVYKCGFSRVPVYRKHPNDVVGLCLTKVSIPLY